MKTRNLLSLVICLIGMNVFAQQQKVAIVSFDNQVKELQDQDLTELVRIELSKHQKFEIIDRYEVNEVLRENDIDMSSCYSKTCLIKAGELLSANKMVSGSVDRLGESIYVRLRMLDVRSESIEKEVVQEYRLIPEKIIPMVAIAVNDLMGIKNDESLVKSLSSGSSYESAVNNPHYNRLELSGPRMGYTFIMGEASQIMKAPKSEGGYDAYPALFQFGYQFEKQYLNEGKFQALFEFIPMVSGLDQGLFIPSLTVMNGLRNNVNGIEFAIGPSINFVKMSQQYQADDNEWYRPQDRENVEDFPMDYRLDSRGEVKIQSYVVLAAGFSFRSGKMNIPVNAFFIPGKETQRFGFSFGFNARG